VHTNGRHRRGRLAAVNVINENHRITFVRRTFAARSNARPASDTSLRVYEHCFLHDFILNLVSTFSIIILMKSKHRKTLALIFARPVSGNIRWNDIESLFKNLGAEISEAEGSRVRVFLFGEIRVFHRPHPSPMTDKGAVESIRKWLDENGAAK